MVKHKKRRYDRISTGPFLLIFPEPRSHRMRDSFRCGKLTSDSAFADPDIYEYCEANRITYFIVTNSRLAASKVVKVYNGRGDVENRIKEGKNTLRWDKTSCHRFPANEARLKMGMRNWVLGKVPHNSDLNNKDEINHEHFNNKAFRFSL